MKAAFVDLGPYVVLILIGFLPNEVWRVVGLLTSRGLHEHSQLVVWSRTVATALLAGVVAKLILFSSGELAGIPLTVRLGATVLGFAAFMTFRRSVFAGVAVGEAVLLLGGYFLV
jgi:hypothetical protein